MDKEKVELQLKFTPNYSKYSVLLNCYRVGGMKWNDVDGAIFHKIDLNKEEVLSALGVKQKIADLEAKLAESEKTADEFHDKLLDEMQNRVDREVELTNCLNNVVDERDQLKQQLEEEKNRNKKLNHEAQKYYEDAYCNGFQNQKAIAVLEEMLDNEVYINSKLDFEDGNYVLSKIIRAKIEELRNGRN